MKLGRIALLLAAATALQFFVGGSPHRAVWPVDFFLLATGMVARGGDFVRAVLVGGVVGIVEDALNHDLIGMNAFAKAALGYGLAFLSIRVMFGGPWAVGGALAAASLVNDLIVAVLGSLLLQAPIVLFSREALWRAVATGASGGVLEAARLFPWREWWERRRLRRLR
ncbi:MAG TPA: rod shape-determining protein MreD [Thermoanaerobaculia bacterium]|nr:rod shape-determining protein MreD [Thermoanaerobaculia bacterium]